MIDLPAAPPPVPAVENFLGAQSFCPSSAALAPVLAGRGVYVGELHGTAESPAVFLCMVRAALSRGGPVAVSLELPPQAANLDDPYWGGEDGRASAAEHAMLAALLEEASRGKTLTITYQDAFSRRDQDAWEKHTAGELTDLSKSSFVLAYGGNAHNRRAKVGPMQYEPAGSYLGPEIKTVWIASRAGGAAWNCAPTCGENPVRAPTSISSISDEVVAGQRWGFDFVVLVPAFSASPPYLRASRNLSRGRLAPLPQLLLGEGHKERPAGGVQQPSTEPALPLDRPWPTVGRRVARKVDHGGDQRHSR